jgi:hypothetical protein
MLVGTPVVGASRMNPARDLARLEERVRAAAAILDWPDERLYLRIPSVSGWSPAQQLDHVLLSLALMFDRVETLEVGCSESIRPSGSPGLVGQIILLTGWIPRGRADAPASVHPDPRPVRARLRGTLATEARRTTALRERAASLGGVQGTLEHPILGAFGVPQWLRFADVHTKHHLAIVAAIDRHRAVGAAAPDEGVDECPEYGIGAETP